jgi:succinate dehydrogenase/fumarate reductase flavoprotein subunit
VELLLTDGAVTGAVALHLGSGAPVILSAKSTVLATGGLTRLYRRNSASANMGGDGYALAMRAGASLVDMEFVQFFPIGHLAPRLIGMDPIMWDPFRYKLGGRLLNNRMEEFTQHYGVAEDGKYVITRDLGSRAILKEVEAGRGSPHGGVYLSFQHCSVTALREAFGPVIDRLAANGIDLTKMPVEVAPIAHYHMGGIATDPQMRTNLPGLFAAGEAVGGANGANRLSGNAVTEALVFGRRAGRSAANDAKRRQTMPDVADNAQTALSVTVASSNSDLNTAEIVQTLQATMQDHVGALRNRAGLTRALDTIAGLTRELGESPPGDGKCFDMRRIDWFDLRNMLLVARAVTEAALARNETRGSHQREDYPQLSPDWAVSQFVRLQDGGLAISTGASHVSAAVAS